MTKEEYLKELESLNNKFNNDWFNNKYKIIPTFGLGDLVKVLEQKCSNCIINNSEDDFCDSKEDHFFVGAITEVINNNVYRVKVIESKRNYTRALKFYKDTEFKKIK